MTGSATPDVIRQRWARVAILALSLLLGLQLGTQFVAVQLGHAPALGPRLRIGPYAVYPPWSCLTWRARFGSHRPDLFTPALGLVGLTVVAGLVTLSLLTHGGSSRGRAPALRADHWADRRDLHRARLLTGRGTVVGQLPRPRKWWPIGPHVHRHYRGYLTYDGPEHQLISGASRSGKGVGHVVPTLLNWPDSALVYDVKNELWDITAGFRAKRVGRVIRFNPTASGGDTSGGPTSGARFNPLLEIRKGDHEIRDTQNLVEILVNPDGSKRTFDVWDQNASQLLVALVLHVLYTEPDDRKHLGVVRQRLLDIDTTLRDMQTLPHRCNRDGEPDIHPEIARVAKDLEQQPEKFQASVRATAAGYLTLYADEIVCRNVATSDFTVADLVCSERPVTLYLQPPPSDAPRLRPLMRLILNQVCRALMEHPQTDSRGRPKRHRLLLMLDEFPTLGRLDFFTTNLRQMAGYGIKAHLVVQSFNDIVEQHGPHNTIIDNCHVLTAFASADTTTQQRVSQMTGTVVEYRDSYSRPRPRGLNPFERGSVSTSEHVRPLLSPGEVRLLPDDTQLVFVNGCKPIRCAKVRYYEEDAFTTRLFPPPEAPPPPPEVPPAPEAEATHGARVRHDWIGERAKGERVQNEADDPPANTPSRAAHHDDADDPANLQASADDRFGVA